MGQMGHISQYVIRTRMLVVAQKNNVFYIDIREEKIEPRQQQYTLLSPKLYKFENIPNDFEAEITVDEWGLAVQYSGLFERIAIQESNY